MQTKKQALKQMERKTADAAGVPIPHRPQFVEWYRKTFDYRLKALPIAIRFLFKK